MLLNNSIFTDPILLDEINCYGKIKSIKKDDVIMSPGDDVYFLPIVIHGVFRIIRQNKEGKEIFLYHLYENQTCAITVNCCLEHKKSSIKAIAEKDTEVLLIPGSMVDVWFRYAEWRNYINGTFSKQFLELIEVIDLIAFSNMDRLVLHYLQERAKAANVNIINITHQEIADEFHTHREAISRLLRTMEQKNLVKLGRNTIELSVSYGTYVPE